MSVIAHIDMDAFFAAIEQRDDPELRHKPVVIGADPKGGKGRGVVATCSYEARSFGIHSAMSISEAYQRCPKAIFLPPNRRKYRRASRRVFQILKRFTPDIEPISIDEAFLDLTGCYHFYQTPLKTCQKIKQDIDKDVGLTASMGIAPNKMVAKIASDFCKPDGLLEITEEKLLDFLWPLPIEKLWGVGKKTQTSLNLLGLKTIGDIARASLERLSERFGVHGAHLYHLANGIDFRTVETRGDIKSVSHEHTFDQDTSDSEQIRKVLLLLSEKVSRRLRKRGLKAKTLTVKIRLKGFKTYTRACTFTERTNFTEIMFQNAQEILREFLKPHHQVRLIGVRMANFDDPYVQESLFQDKTSEKRENMHKAVDTIKDRFGENAIHRAGS